MAADMDSTSTITLQNNVVYKLPDGQFLAIEFTGDSRGQRTMQEINRASGDGGNMITAFTVMTESCIGSVADSDTKEAFFVMSVEIDIDNTAGFSRNKHGKEYGLYCDQVWVRFQPLFDRVGLMQPVPVTTLGASTFDDNMSWSLSGNFGFMGKAAQGSLGGSYAYSQSNARTIPDLVVHEIHEGNCPTWCFQFQNLPKTHGTKGFHYSMSSPPAASTGDLTLNMGWIWSVPAAAIENAGLKGLPFVAQLKARYGYRHIHHNKLAADFHEEAAPIMLSDNAPDARVLLPWPSDDVSTVGEI